MDFKITNYDVATEQICLEQMAEIPIDADFSVADYEGEIKKVLKCEITPYITSKQISSNTLHTEGEAIIKVIYCSPEGEICCHEQGVPFKKSFEGGKNMDGGYCEISKDAFIHSCRAVTERKFSIRGAVKVEAVVKTIDKKEIISDIDNSYFEQLKGEAFATTPIGKTEKNLIIDEEITLPSNMPSAKQIIHSYGSAAITDCKIIADKIIVKGNLKITMLYTSEEKAIKKFCTNLPFNQIVDMVGISELCDCDAAVTICGLNISPRNSDDGEYRKFMLICKLEISASAKCNNLVPVIYDLYSTRYAVTPQCEEVAFSKIIKQVNESFLCKKTLNMPNGEGREILDVWCKIGSRSAKFDSNNGLLYGSLTACVLYNDSEGEPNYFEHIIDFEYPFTLEGDINAPYCNPEINISDCDYSVTNSGEPELKVEMIIKAVIYDTVRYSLITDLNVDENSTKENNSALVAYYADKGENVWEIAKSFLANRSEFMSLNHLTEETVQNPKMLLIPLI